MYSDSPLFSQMKVGRKLRHNKNRNHANYLQINYPMSAFNESLIDWKKSAKFNRNLEVETTKNGTWKQFSHAQDKEDIWIYENWFFGMENGLIIESGALNGDIFSTSYMFEYYFNWAAIHIGNKFESIS